MSDKKLFSYSRERFDVKANIIHSSRQPRYTGYSLPRSSSHQHRVYGAAAWSGFARLLHWRAQFASLLFVTHYGGESDYAEAKQSDNAPEQF